MRQSEWQFGQAQKQATQPEVISQIQLPGGGTRLIKRDPTGKILTEDIPLPPEVMQDVNSAKERAREIVKNTPPLKPFAELINFAIDSAHTPEEVSNSLKPYVTQLGQDVRAETKLKSKLWVARDTSGQYYTYTTDPTTGRPDIASKQPINQGDMQFLPPEVRALLPRTRAGTISGMDENGRTISMPIGSTGVVLPPMKGGRTPRTKTGGGEGTLSTKPGDSFTALYPGLRAKPNAVKAMQGSLDKSVGLQVLSVSLHGDPNSSDPANRKGLLDAVKSGVLDDTLSRQMLITLIQKGEVGSVDSHLQSLFSRHQSPQVAEFRAQYQRAYSAIQSLRTITGLPRSTQALMEAYAAELPNPQTTRDTADGIRQIELIDREIGAATEILKRGGLPGLVGGTSLENGQIVPVDTLGRVLSDNKPSTGSTPNVIVVSPEDMK